MHRRRILGSVRREIRSVLKVLGSAAAESQRSTSLVLGSGEPEHSLKD
jgi:hypothetical protein